MEGFFGEGKLEGFFEKEGHAGKNEAKILELVLGFEKFEGFQNEEIPFGGFCSCQSANDEFDLFAFEKISVNWFGSFFQIKPLGDINGVEDDKGVVEGFAFVEEFSFPKFCFGDDEVEVSGVF